MLRKHKHPLLIFVTAIFLWSIATTVHAGWFGSDDDDKDEQIQQLQDQVAQQGHENGDLITVVVVLGIGVVVALVIGAAMGSRARRASKEGQ